MKCIQLAVIGLPILFNLANLFLVMHFLNELGLDPDPRKKFRIRISNTIVQHNDLKSVKNSVNIKLTKCVVLFKNSEDITELQMSEWKSTVPYSSSSQSSIAALH